MHCTTVAAVAQHYLQRIDVLDTHGPALHSIIQINADAKILAARLDSAPPGTGILFGVPVVLKDNIETADGMLINHADVVGAINVLERGQRLFACGGMAHQGPPAKQEPTEASHAVLV